jgi:hypothetical protein
MPNIKKVLKNIQLDGKQPPEVIIVKEKRKNKTSEKIKDEQGRVLKKDGTPDPRYDPNSKAQVALRAYREQKKKAKELEKAKPPVVQTPIKDESDDDEDEDEFEVETLEIKKKEPKIVEKIVEKEVVKEIPVPEPKVLEEVKQLKEQNKKLQESFYLNEHLNRISNIAKQTSIKF